MLLFRGAYYSSKLYAIVQGCILFIKTICSCSGVHIILKTICSGAGVHIIHEKKYAYVQRCILFLKQYYYSFNLKITQTWASASGEKSVTCLLQMITLNLWIVPGAWVESGKWGASADLCRLRPRREVHHARPQQAAQRRPQPGQPGAEMKLKKLGKKRDKI